METVVIRIDMPPIEAEGEGSSPTDEQMRQEQQARQEFLDFVGPKLAPLPDQPPARAGNIEHIELLGGNTWSRLNHYLLFVSVDIGRPRGIDLESLAPPGGEATLIGSYAPLQRWPEEAPA
jgi:hypothetical protein